VEGLKYSFGGKTAWGTMNRQEAIALLREILEACRGLIEMNYVSLDLADAQIRKSADYYELHVKWVLDERLRQCLTPILEKHQLSMKESKGSIIIYAPK
jgi:archaellum biogenesis ATPase FlaH